ncbi:MAG: TorF family putative porin [Patescibacteria group bacterium]
MNRKCLIALVVGLFVASAPATAQESAFTRSCNVKLLSAFVLDIGARPSDSPALQASCRITHKSGAYGGIWVGQLTDYLGERSPLGTENDYYVGVAKKVGMFTLDVSAWLYDIANPKTFDGLAGDFVDVTGALSCSTCKMSPYLEIHTLYGTGPRSFQGGWYAKVGGGKTVAVNKRFALGVDLNGVHNDGIGGGYANVLRLTVAPTIPLKGGGTLKVPISYSSPLKGEGLEDQFWGGVALFF